MFVYIYLMVRFFRCPLPHPTFVDVSGSPPSVVALVSSEVPRDLCTKDKERNQLEHIRPTVCNSYWLIHKHTLFYNSRPPLISQLHKIHKGLC